MEIERKFLLTGFPFGLQTLEEKYLEQGYLHCGSPEVRIRKGVLKDRIEYKLAIKGDGLLSREEVEFDISEAEYEQLKTIVPAKMITKDYKVYDLEGLRLEVSYVDAGNHSEFFYAEIEFSSEEEAEKFNPPSFLFEEVTYDRNYKMKNYWKRTRLKEKSF